MHVPRLRIRQLPALFIGSLSALLACNAALSEEWRRGQYHNVSNWSLAAAETALNVPGINDGCPIETADGLSLLLASNRPGTLGSNDIWTSDRDSIDAPWTAPVQLPPPINTPSNDFCPTPVWGRSLFFVSERPASATGPIPCGGGDIYLSRQSPSGTWRTPQLLDCSPKGPNFNGGERSPALAETWFGTFLIYSSTGDDGGDSDIYISRMGADGTFGPGEVITQLSTPYEDIMPNVRKRDDGWFEIVFSSNRPTSPDGRPAFGGQDVYYSTYVWGVFTPPRNLGAAVNTAGTEQRATLSADGKRLHFGRDGDIYTSYRTRGFD